ncbi:MAG TPA: non-homologous end-joining DNA ligase [Nitriliruptorales bacterium]|nr:non-homologous end-joining DNA ligase [Nitriliruptorales bacterium]
MALTHPDRVLFPDEGITKGQVVRYYARIAAVMLPHLRGRPLTLQRFPEGIAGSGFFMKDAPDHFPDWIRTAEVPRRSKGGRIHQVFLCEDPAGLVYLANQGTLTFHVWPARADDLDHPDLLVLDLDPPQGGRLGALRDAARAVRAVLRDLGLVPYLQTTGSRGYHVVAPLDRSADFDRTHALARRVADLLARRHPDQLTTAQRKDRRGHRLFLDTNRNAYAQTFAAPYSLRPRPGAPVATPLDWDELGRVEPGRYTLTNLFRRLGQKDDPWGDLHQHGRGLGDAEDRLAVLERDAS